jgi:hypothetical protein
LVCHEFDKNYNNTYEKIQADIQIPYIGNIALDKITEKYTTTAFEFALVKAQGFLSFYSPA